MYKELKKQRDKNQTTHFKKIIRPIDYLIKHQSSHEKTKVFGERNPRISKIIISIIIVLD